MCEYDQNKSYEIIKDLIRIKDEPNKKTCYI